MSSIELKYYVWMIFCIYIPKNDTDHVSVKGLQVLKFQVLSIAHTDGKVFHTSK